MVLHQLRARVSLWIRAQSEPVATARFNHVKIGGVTCTVGPDFRPLREDPLLRDGDPLHTERLLKLIGIESRHVAPPGITTLDLCEQAGRRRLMRSSLSPRRPIIRNPATPAYCMGGWGVRNRRRPLILIKDALAGYMDFMWLRAW